MIQDLQDFAAGFPEAAQWLGVALVSAIPFVESYFGSIIGVLLGLHPAIAITVAVLGNIVSMAIVVIAAGAVRQRATRDSTKELSPRRAKLKQRFDRFGVAGVSLLGQTLLPSQITSAAMVSFGASRNAVLFWQTISIILWGTAFGVLAALGVNLAA